MKIEDISTDPLKNLESPSPRSVLVVDDEEAVAKFVARLLDLQGHKTSIAHNGAAALEILKQKPHELVITDLRMPNMDGLELVTEAKKLNRDQNIIIITGYGTMEIFMDAMRAGASDFIVKPIDRDQLLAAVDRVLSRKSLEESLIARTKQLVQSEKMATVGVLSTGIAHEINNPTTFIRTNLQLMNEYIKRLGPRLSNLQDPKNGDVVRNIILTEFPQMISEALKGTERIQKIVSGVKHYAHRGDEHTEETVDIREVIAQAVNLVKARLRKHIVINESYLNIKEIKGRFSKLEQVFVNLMINSADAVEDKVQERRSKGEHEYQGMIDVSATVIEGDVVEGQQKTPDYLVLTFYDNGAGISREKLTRVFDPFYTTKPVGVGTGLGLYICYEIIKQHGGEITVQSELGEGTAFIIKLPVEGAAATRSADAPAPAGKTAGARNGQ